MKVPGPWLTWFKVASVPALVALLTGPLILYKIFPPESKNTPEAPGIATKRLEVRTGEGVSGDLRGGGGCWGLGRAAYFWLSLCRK